MITAVGIVGYRMGNVTSLRNAFTALGVDAEIVEHAPRLREMSHVVLPGVGAFPRAMEQLHSLGFEAELRRLVLEQGRPLLGVCLGMQVLASFGEEHRVCPGLGFIPGRVTLITTPGLRVPHVGWNDTVATQESALLGAAGTVGCFYYVHSYHLVPDDPAAVVMRCDYGGDFTAGVQRGNVYGVQFHPEKSHGSGLDVLRRFTQARPC